MITKIINSKEVRLYDSIDELPITRFHKYNKYLLIDSGIGSDLSDIDAHIERLYRYISHDSKLAVQELQNLRQSLYMVSQEISAKFLSFAVLVESIDGVKRDDLSDEGMKNTLELLKEMPNGMISEIVESLKKKLDSELKLYFPAIFEDSSLKEYYDKLKVRTKVVLEGIIEDKDVFDELERIDFSLLNYSKPKCFIGKESEEIKFDKQFENMCLLIGQKLNKDAKLMNVLEYYNAFDYIRNENKK
jgi:hypothetical protein